MQPCLLAESAGFKSKENPGQSRKEREEAERTEPSQGESQGVEKRCFQI